jgi:hypothetical protein
VASLSLVLWILLGESVFALVAAGGAWRAFQRDAAPAPNPGLTGYFAALLVSLGVAMWLMPGTSAGFPDAVD